MKKTDFAYAAGYIDGDGCFQIGNQKWGSHLVVVSVRPEPIVWFARHFGGTIRTIIPRSKNRSTSYHFRFSKKGLYCLPSIANFLVEKMEECLLFMDFKNSVGEVVKKPLAERMKTLKEKGGIIHKSIKEELEEIKNTISPSEVDFAYLAGYIDAECSMDISRTKQKNAKNFTYRPQIQCNNTKSPFFYWAAKRFGGQFHFLDKSHLPNCRNQMLWRISNLQLDPILKGIYPFLISKKQICENMMELRRFTNSGKGRKSPNDPDYKFWISKISPIRESIYQKVRHLNNTI